jgi:hypothetical protein
MHRRSFLLSASLVIATRRALAQGAVPRALIDDLVAGNRILANQNILDAQGHLSVRHPSRADRFLLARSMPPALVTADDILEYDLNADPIDGRGRTSYRERFIHSEIYRARPDVMAVVHSHSPSVIPFGITGQKLRPVFHVSGFLGSGSAHFEIRDTAGDAMAAPRQEQLDVGVGEERILSGRQPLAFGDPQRWYPVWVRRIAIVGVIDEPTELAPALHAANVNHLGSSIR